MALSGVGTKKSSSVKSTKVKGAGKGSNRTSGALGLDEPPKPEKKQILFKRKKEQEEVPPQETSFPSEGDSLSRFSVRPLGETSFFSSPPTPTSEAS